MNDQVCIDGEMWEVCKCTEYDENKDKYEYLETAVNFKKNRCYDAVATLSQKYNMEQVNIHCMISEESYDDALQLIKDVKTDPRLSKVNAVVFLSLKQKGRGVNFHALSQAKFKTLVEAAMKAEIGFGFDSCSAFKFLKAVEDHPRYEEFKTMSEPCESTCFSSYVNEEGKFFPCSFTETGEGICVADCDNFLDDVWNAPSTIDARNKIIKNRNDCKNCAYFTV